MITVVAGIGKNIHHTTDTRDIAGNIYCTLISDFEAHKNDAPKNDCWKFYLSCFIGIRLNVAVKALSNKDMQAESPIRADIETVTDYAKN